MFGKYTKTIFAFVATVAGFVASAVSGGITGTEWVNIAIMSVGASQVFYNENTPEARFAKGVAAVVSAGLVALNSVLTGGVSEQEWYVIIAAVLGAVAVYGFSNEEDLEVALPGVDGNEHGEL